MAAEVRDTCILASEGTPALIQRIFVLEPAALVATIFNS